jgi:hypothetical protein
MLVSDIKKTVMHALNPRAKTQEKRNRSKKIEAYSYDSKPRHEVVFSRKVPNGLPLL